LLMTLNIPVINLKAIHWSKMTTFAPVMGSPSKYCCKVRYGKTKWWIYQMVKKFENMFTGFDRVIPAGAT